MIFRFSVLIPLYLPFKFFDWIWEIKSGEDILVFAYILFGPITLPLILVFIAYVVLLALILL